MSVSNETHSVLFICTANRIRSVMAEALFQELVQEVDPEGTWQIGSAGTWAHDGLPPMPFATEAMAQRGIDVSAHRSRSVDQTPLADYALILVMERGHKESLSWELPELRDRIHLVTEMIDAQYEVTDPVSGPMHDHAHAADVLHQVLVDGYDRIYELSVDGETGERVGSP
jgi:protein-tyrosine-phosphatase